MSIAAMRVLVVGLCLAALAAAAAAQTKPGAPPISTPDAKAAAKLRALQEQQGKDKPDGTTPAKPPGRVVDKAAGSPTTIKIDPADRHLSPEQLREKYKSRLGATYTRFTATCDPPRIAPGGHGRLVILMTLDRDAVMLASGPATIDLAPFQGRLALGSPALRPATPARLAAAFRGKPAFDDFAVFDVPVAVAADAPPGAHTVELAMTYELYRGQTGGWLERFLDHLKFAVEVGAPDAATAPIAVADDGNPRPGAAPGAPDPATVGADAAEPAPPDRSAPPAGDDGSTGLPWILGAAGLVLAAVLLLARRRG